MEDRLTGTADRRAGATIAALVAIVAITVAWWALALWPADSTTPEWLERTRAAYFGSPPGGLPDTRGWLLLIGEPLGLVAMLLIVWPDAVRNDVRRLRNSVAGRTLLTVVPLLVAGLLFVAVRRVAAVQRDGAVAPELVGVMRDVAVDLGGLVLVDQHGESRSLEEIAATPTLLTAAFGHCETVCPTLVRDLMRVRADAGRSEVPLVVITVDPWRDTPSRLAGVARAWQLGPADLLLSGSVAEVELALDRLAVARSRNLDNGDVVHVPVVFAFDGGNVAARFDGGWTGVATLLNGSRFAARPNDSAPGDR